MKKCEVCKKEEKFRQFSPDYEMLYFCSLKHYRKFYSEHIYRALPVEDIGGKEVSEKRLDRLWGLTRCPRCGSKVKKSNIKNENPQ